MTRAALYARVSTAGQLRNDPWASLPRQLEALRAQAARLGFAVALEVEEQGSGAKADRPGWARVLAGAKAGEIQVIMVVAFDRMTRSEELGDWETVKKELRRLRVRLVTIKAGEVDLSGTATAELRSDLDATLSKFERLQTRQRTMEGKAAKAKDGGYIGGRVPLGYDVTFDPATGAKGFVVNEGEAAVVRRIVAEYQDGTGCASIARGLNGDGVKTKRGGAWSARAVRVVLENWTYAGIKELDKAKVRRRDPDAVGGVVPAKDFVAILPIATTQQVHDEIARRARNNKRTTNGTTHPLSGIMRCNGCNGPMSIVYTGNISRRYYHCSKRQTEPGGCPAPSRWNADTAEACVRAALVLRLQRFARLTTAPEPASDAADDEAADVRRRLAALEAEEMTLARQLGQGVITSELFQRTQGAIATDHAALRARLMHLEMAVPKAVTSLADRKAQALEVGAMLKLTTLTPRELRGLFVLAVDGVWLEADGVVPGKRGKIRQRVRRLDLTLDP